MASQPDSADEGSWINYSPDGRGATVATGYPVSLCKATALRRVGFGVALVLVGLTVILASRRIGRAAIP